jgi:predicted nucleic acid-binding protein
VILVDTNAWVSHLRTRDASLVRLLDDGRVVTCHVVIGELLLGAGLPRNLADLLALLPALPCPTAAETRQYVVRHLGAFRASGVGWADAQILVTAAEAGALVYSSDVAVRRVWKRLGFRLP